MLDYTGSSCLYCPTSKSLLILNFMSWLPHRLTKFGSPLDIFHQALITWLRPAVQYGGSYEHECPLSSLYLNKCQYASVCWGLHAACCRLWVGGDIFINYPALWTSQPSPGWSLFSPRAGELTRLDSSLISIRMQKKINERPSSGVDYTSRSSLGKWSLTAVCNAMCVNISLQGGRRGGREGCVVSRWSRTKGKY